MYVPGSGAVNITEARAGAVRARAALSEERFVGNARARVWTGICASSFVFEFEVVLLPHVNSSACQQYCI
jgi:hypothetical protein